MTKETEIRATPNYLRNEILFGFVMKGEGRRNNRLILVHV